MAALAITPLWLELPTPEARAVDHALRVEGDKTTPVTLPLIHQQPGGTAHYRLSVQLDEAPEPLFLFVPMVNERIEVFLNGFRIKTMERALMRGVAAGVPTLAPLPADWLQSGNNVIDLHISATGSLRGYLSPLYVGTASELVPHYRLRAFVFEDLRRMVTAGQLFIALVVLAGWLYRPEEPLFGWLSALLTVSLVNYVGVLGDLLPGLTALLPYAFAISMSSGFILAIIALLITGSPVPRWLKAAVAALPATSLLTLTGVLSERALVVGVAAPVGILALLAALIITLRGAVLRGITEAWLLLLPMFLTAVVAVGDIAIALGLVDAPVFLSIFYRPLLLIGIAMILMRRLGISLMQLDNANNYLKQRLAEQELELERLHREERRKAAERVRGEERQRLTTDLHDGVSGHLVSIIALSEREKAAVIENAAREALEDLRLVIHSLDINDNELAVALSGLRERLERQLKRLGIELDWSIVQLPEISGVTPTHALNILRILQEAITNAIKHGQATRILVRGTESAEGEARIVVENNGAPFSSDPGRGGTGLNNMRRRIKQLGGEIRIEPLTEGTRLQMFLPLQLPGAVEV